MANPVKTLDDLRRQAEQQLKVTTGWATFELLYHQNNRGRGGAVLHEFSAVRPGAANAPSKTIYLDGDGKLSVPVKKAATPPPAAVRTTKRLPGVPITIDPTENHLTLGQGQTFDEILTVHIPPEPFCTADVYFLADLTGSMNSSLLDEIALNFGNIAAQWSAAGCDLAYGAGFYKDFGSDITDPAQVFVPLQAISANPSDTAAAVGLYSSNLGGGGDDPEAQFYAFDRIANDPAIGWRSGARKILVWLGDYPGHDPVCAALTGLGYDITEITATSSLISRGIRVMALDIANLDGDPMAGNSAYAPWGCTQNGTAGQAGRIAAATNGLYTGGVDASNIVGNILNMVGSALASYGSVSLVPTGGTAPFVSSISPGYYGPIDLGSPYDLPFNVTFLGVQPCSDVEQVFNGTIDVVVDGAVVAQKTVEIIVPPCDGPRPTDCTKASSAAGNELQALSNDKEFIMTATPGCSGIADPSEIGKVCQPLDMSKIQPCFFIKWGDGKRDQIETEDFEVLLLTVCNPYSNIRFEHVLIPKIEVTDAFGGAVPLLPDGTESAMLAPSRMICFDGIPPCSCRSFELALKTCGAPEGPYKIKFTYCFKVCFESGGNPQEFDFELVTS